MDDRRWRAGLAAVALSLCTLPAGAIAMGRMAGLAQNASGTAPGAIEPGQAPVAAAPAASPANSPEQVRKAQIELRRLDCLKGRIDGRLGEQTRQAVKTFWASAKQPVVDVAITDELIADLAERGDNFCRPPRPFFAIGGRAGGTSFLHRPSLPAPGRPRLPPRGVSRRQRACAGTTGAQ